MSEPIEIEIPLRPRYAATVRAVAAVVGADVGFSVDDIDDLRLAVNEAVSLLSDVASHESGRLRIEFTAEGDAITVRCERRGVDGNGAAPDQLAVRIFDAVVDEYELGDGQITFVKRLRPTG